MTCTIHEDRYAFLFISRFIFLRMRNISDKRCRENRNILFIMNSFFLENRALYGIMWKNIVELGRPRMTVRPMRITCWIPKATNALRICNSYCFSTATVVARKRLIVPLHVHCLSCRSFTCIIIIIIIIIIRYGCLLSQAFSSRYFS